MVFTGIIKYICNAKIEGSTLMLYGCEDALGALDGSNTGDSVAINGVCLTIKEIKLDIDAFVVDAAFFDISEETFSKTNFYDGFEGEVHVEPAMKFGDKVGGHFLSGHVHQTGSVYLLERLNGGYMDMWIDIGVGDKSIRYKGSIAVDGVSLTIAEIKDRLVRVSLIPHTLEKTLFKNYKMDQKVNVEFDSSLIEGLNPYQGHTPSQLMEMAIEEGEKGRYTAPPNPWVGCVIAMGGSILSTGYHRVAGSPHAEVNALEALGERSIGEGAIGGRALGDEKHEKLTLYVTLEPCCHFGRTPPCTDLLIKKGIKHVVVGVLDPDTRVAGKGIEKLREAGIKVEMIEDLDIRVYQKVLYSLRQYLYFKKSSTPYVTVKIALSVDNCYRYADGTSKWITGEPARKDGHALRASCQTIIIGAKTVQTDNPELTVRYGIENEIIKQPNIMVIDGESLYSNDLKVLNSFENIIATTKERYNKWLHNKIRPYVMDTLQDALSYIKSMHCLVEGGGKLQYSFFKEKLVNELVIYRSSKILGSQGYKWDLPLGVNLELIETRMIGKDKMERYLVDYPLDPLFTDHSPGLSFDEVKEAIKVFSKGGMVVVMDDENRENEGDLIVAASMMTESQMTEMINHSTGIICVSIDTLRAKQLNLPLMCVENTDTNKTAFTISVDHISTGTGVSSKDRVCTVKALAELKCKSTDFRRPGHIFPLISNPEGLKKRQGHTEAANELCRLANIYPRVAVLSELQNKDGSMSRGQQCYHYAKSNNIPIITVKSLIEYSNTSSTLLSTCNIASEIGERPWKMMCFDSGNYDRPHIVFAYPYQKFPMSLPVENPGEGPDPIPLRIHSECFTGDVFKSKHCDCGRQLESSMIYIVNKGCGVIIFPSGHEGRGIGIVDKVKAYDLQQKDNKTTYEANEALGYDPDLRSFDFVPNLLTQIGIKKVELLTDNPDKIKALGSMVSSVKPIITTPNEHNISYLNDKKERFSVPGSLGSTEFTPVPHKHPVLIFDKNKDLSRVKVALVHSSWHSEYISKILDILTLHLKEMGVGYVENIQVPGTNEIPLKSQQISSKFNGIICIGILLKGDTLHFENVSSAVSNGIMQAQLQTGIPMMNCILSCYDIKQITDRIEGPKSTLKYVAESLIHML